MSREGKARQASKNKQKGKYKLQFLRTVKKTGKWRGKKKSVMDAN